MKNFVQRGENITLPAPYAVLSGAGALIGALFAVASVNAANAEEVAFVTTGVFDLAKAPSEAWAIGVRVYWDNTNRRCTTTASGNTLVGVAVRAVAGGAGDVVGRVRLNGTF